MQRPYNQAYFPPIPVLSVRFGIAETGRYTDEMVGIVDTGADATIVPTVWLDQIEAAVHGYGTVRGQWGEARLINLYVVDVVIESITLPGVWVIGDETEQDVILGRDVLNRLRLLLDGLKSQTKVVGY